MTGATPGADSARRRAFIDFVRANHPDVGGDPEVFRRGLEAFRRRQETGTTSGSRPVAPVQIHRRRGGPGVFLDRLAAARRRRRRPPRVQ